MMTFTNSPLVTHSRPAKHKEENRNHIIDTVTIHCVVGQWTAEQGCDYFATVERRCSSNYIVGKDGSIGLSVEEKDRSYCSSNPENDHRAITIEVASDVEEPYAVTDTAYNTLILLLADICRRNGITMEQLKEYYDASFEQAVIRSVQTGKVMCLIRDAATITEV